MSEEAIVFSRIRSSRLAGTRVACETLTIGNDVCHHPVDGLSVPFRGHDEYPELPEGIPNAADADAQLVQTHYKLTNSHEGSESQRCTGRLHDMKEKVPPTVRAQRRSLPRWFHKMSICDCNISDVSNPGRRHSSVRPSSGNFSRSNVLLPHSGPILLPIGSHAGSVKMSSRPAMLMKTSSIISNTASAKKVSVLLLNDPSSPRVTCLGRVKIKQKCHRQCKNVTCVACDNENVSERHLPSLMQDRTSDTDDANSKVFDSILLHRKGLMTLARSMESDRDGRSKESKRKSSPSIPRRRTESRTDINLTFRCKKSEDGSCNESKVAFDSNDQKWDLVSPHEASCSESKTCMSSKVSVSVMPSPWMVGGGRELEDRADGEEIRKSPPRDALLQMKIISSKRFQKVEECEEGKWCKAQKPALKTCALTEDSKYAGISRQFSICCSSSERHILPETSFSGASNCLDFLKEQKPSILACDSHFKLNNVQTPLPNAQLSLWQRRAIRQLRTLQVGRT